MGTFAAVIHNGPSPIEASLIWLVLGGMWHTDGPVRHKNGLFHVVILVRVVHAPLKINRC